MDVIRADATHCRREVHEWLNQLTGRRDFGDRFEHLAHDYACFKRGRCKVSLLAERPINPPMIVIRPQPDAMPMQEST